MSKFQHQIEEVSLIQAPGVWIPYDLVMPPPHANDENALEVLNLLQPKKYSPDSDELCIVPVMPAVPPYIDESVLNESRKHVEIAAPLKGTKSPYSDKSSPGFRSGTRSCIIVCRKVKSDETSPNDWVVAQDSKNNIKYVVDFEHGNTLVRAKGCGMWTKDNDIPFPAITIQEAVSMHAPKGKTVFEVRGVCFENTSCTEMVATHEIEQNLAKLGLLCGNNPIGFWFYNQLQNDESPLITKTVSLFETIGDYRLESHVFPGLELLLSKKYDQIFAEKVIDLISPLYDKDKLPCYNMRTTKKRKNLNFWQKIKMMLTNDTFYNLNDFEIDELNDESFRKAGIVPTHEIYERIKDLDEGFINLVKVYGRLGFEIGRSISVIHRTGYLWGSFVDHNPNLFHDNAHPDNLVILTREICKSRKKLQIVAPLDFDMSYKKENGVDWWKKPPIPDQSKIVDNMPGELTALSDIIGGLYATFLICTTFKPRKPPEGKLYDVLWMLRDCAVYEYYQGYQKINSDRCRGNDISADAIYDIIDEALSLSCHFNS